MQRRTDLALEQQELYGGTVPGVQTETASSQSAQITRMQVLNEEGAKEMGKPVGTYITIEVPPFSDDGSPNDGRREAITHELESLLPKEGLILIAGLGNSDITPDALGPKTAAGIFATRHISGELARSVGLGELRPVAAVAPGVLGKTGIETAEILSGIVQRIQPAAVIVIDALASRRLSRLGCTVQLSNTGISPGSGVGNTRSEISQTTLGVPVIAVGVPTVVDAATLAADLLEENGTEKEDRRQIFEPRGAQMIVTPREIDLLIDRAAGLVSHSINCALHPQLSPEDLLALVS